MFQDLLPDPATLPPAAIMAAVFAIALLETSIVVGVLLPGEVLMAACIGVLPAAWSPLSGAVAAAGCLVGQLLGYLIGRRLGPGLRRSWVGRKAGAERIAHAERLVRDSGVLLLVTARFVSVVHTLAPVLAGALRMPAGRFTRSAALSAVLWAVVWTGLGVLAGETGRLVDHGLVTAVLVIIGVVTATVVTSRLLRAQGPARRGGAGGEADVSGSDTRDTADLAVPKEQPCQG